MRLLVFIGVYVGSVGVFRYLTEKPVLDGVLTAALGALGIVIARIIAAVRTVRAVLRENSLLE
jgi:hypothetical protein